eukprot:sb/3471459/
MLTRIIISTRLPLTTTLRTPLFNNLSPKRCVQTFNTSGGGGWWSNLLNNKVIQFGLWFTGVMTSIAIVSGNAQAHRYLFSSENTGKSRAMSLNEIENLTQNKGGEKKKDKKGIEEIMSDLYTEHIENKDLEDWDNVRTPRPTEPELYEEQQVIITALASAKVAIPYNNMLTQFWIWSRAMILR